ncbi:HAD family hydrolase [Thioclava nitratireducens]|uniref:HAD family hydrolase n=1 Tax=Thioclava nitratireducens TaxID=1915078 RepID=A0ABN4XC62_9RHOB|nr:HAD-IA family hydrolase [Thioclava nitratireducens]AQS47038.1 HAD family hydrolase [Thioclava nitratireducens]
MKLAIFDVDGTISDSQNHITHAMTLGFEAAGLPAPAASEVLQIVGLSLPLAVARLAPEHDAETQARIVEGYKQSYMTTRAASPAPLYPGAEALLRKLAARDDMLLAVATGKSRRGLRALIEHHGLEGLFVSLQTADDHPSKPHPSMIGAALSETGVDARDAVMIGDTSFDMAMGRSAGVATIGVRWGYHASHLLEAAGAHWMVDDFDSLETTLLDLWEMSA